MSKEFYVPRKFVPSSLVLIEHVNKVVGEYRQQGLVLTVRQLYYQLVARGIIENNLKSYKNTCSIINDGRLAGLIDWDMIEDRTREFIDRAHWDSGKDILEAVAGQFHTDMWANQARRVYVVVEKEALVGVLSGLCRQYDVPLLAARGYPSVSVVRRFAIGSLQNSENPLIIHLGDHDPSGIDMTRDLIDRVHLLSRETEFELKRIALNMPQIEELRPPPNPAKETDARSPAYIEKYGNESWELDALEPKYLTRLVEKNITREIDDGLWEERQGFITDTRKRLQTAANKWKD